MTFWATAMLLGLSGCEEPQDELASRLGSREARANGRSLFLEHCAICHGERADGHGRRRSALSGPPANFGDPSWLRRTNPRRTFAIIRGGVPGTSMPAWKVLDEPQTWDLVAYLHAVSEHGAELSR